MTSGRLQSLQPNSRGSLARFTTLRRRRHPGDTPPQQSPRAAGGQVASGSTILVQGHGNRRRIGRLGGNRRCRRLRCRRLLSGRWLDGTAGPLSQTTTVAFVLSAWSGSSRRPRPVASWRCQAPEQLNMTMDFMASILLESRNGVRRKSQLSTYANLRQVGSATVARHQ